MATINHKVKILNEDKTAYDTYHVETNIGQVYDFSKSKWLNEIISDIELELSNVTGGINVSELNERLSLTIEDLESAESMINAIEAELAKKYVKPDNGITIEDLNQAIKDSLTKADKIPAIEEELAKVRTDLKSYIDSKIEEIQLQLQATVEEFIATEGQTSVILENPYNLSTDVLSVQVGGIEQFMPDNYTKNTDENGVTTITFAEALPEGVDITVIYYGGIDAFDTIITSHIDDKISHITEEERNKWNEGIKTKIATRTEVGSVKVGNGLNVNLSGELSASGQLAKLTLDTGQVLPANGNDLNDMVEGGFYYGYSLKNAPSPAGYVIVLRRNSTYVSQLFFDNNGAISNNLFRRNMSNGEWQGWVKVLDADDVLDDLTSTDITSALSANKGRELKELIDAKADKTTATATNDGLMSMVDKIKLDSLDDVNEYIHPETHPASMILEDAQRRFVSDTEKSTWNNKADKTIATTSANGLFSSTDKAKLDGIATGANKVNVVDVLTSTSATDALSANAGKSLKDLIDSKTVEVPVVTTSTNGLMIASDKMKLDTIANGATNTVVTNTLTSTSTSNALSAYQGKVLNDKIVSHMNNTSNPHGVTTEHINYLTSAKLPTNSIETYAKGITIFGLSGFEATDWKNIIDTTLPTTLFGYVETTHAPSGSNSRGFQKVIFIDSNAITLGIYERSAYGASKWGAWNKIYPLPEASGSQKGIVMLDTRLEGSSNKALPANVGLAMANLLAQMHSRAESAYGSAQMVLIPPSTYNETVLYVTPLNSGDSTKSYRTALGSGTMATAGYTTALGAGSRATAYSSTALGSFAYALNAYEGQLGTNYGGGGAYNWYVKGTMYTQGGKNFEIPHPHPDKKHTHMLRHGAVESPTEGDTLYRYTVTATEDNQTIEIDLPDYFVHLNKNVDVWVNPFKHFGRAYGEWVEEKLFITCEKAGDYKVLAIGTRNDDGVQGWTDKGAVREIGESWLGETHSFEVDEIKEFTEFGEEL